MIRWISVKEFLNFTAYTLLWLPLVLLAKGIWWGIVKLINLLRYIFIFIMCALLVIAAMFGTVFVLFKKGFKDVDKAMPKMKAKIKEVRYVY